MVAAFSQKAAQRKWLRSRVFILPALVKSAQVPLVKALNSLKAARARCVAKVRQHQQRRVEHEINQAL
jgi:hypothetical protein